MKKDFVKMIKNKHIQLLIIIFIIGTVLMTCFNTSEKEKVKVEAVGAQNESEEEKLSGILSEISGVGDVSVMVTYYGTGEKDIAYETKSETANNEERSERSEDKKAVMSDGEPVIVRETYPKVKGVIVIAEGADDVQIKRAISDAVVAVLDVPAHRVCIYGKEE